MYSDENGGYSICCAIDYKNINMKFQMKNGVFDLDMALSQLVQLPDSLKAVVEPSIIQCKDSGNVNFFINNFIYSLIQLSAVGTEKCQSSFNIAKCMYEFNPDVR